MTVAEASKQASMLPLLVHNVAGRMLDPLVVIVVRSSRCTKEESVLQQIVQFVHERIMFFQLRTASVDYRYLRRHRKNMKQRPWGGLRVYQHAALYQREGSWSVRCSRAKQFMTSPCV